MGFWIAFYPEIPVSPTLISPAGMCVCLVGTVMKRMIMSEIEACISQSIPGTTFLELLYMESLM